MPYPVCMKWLGFVADTIARFPVERILVKPRDTSKGLPELAEILQEAQVDPPAKHDHAPLQEDTIADNLSAPEEPERPKVHLERSERADGPTLEETVAYQNREIAKILLVLASHCVQRWRIAGKICDCGADKHFPHMEMLAEETVPMVDNPGIYHRIIEWVQEVGPKCSIPAVRSGEYDGEYKGFADQARDLRKELMGSIEPSSLFPDMYVPESEEVLDESG